MHSFEGLWHKIKNPWRIKTSFFLSVEMLTVFYNLLTQCLITFTGSVLGVLHLIWIFVNQDQHFQRGKTIIARKKYTSNIPPWWYTGWIYRSHGAVKGSYNRDVTELSKNDVYGLSRLMYITVGVDEVMLTILPKGENF